MAVSTQNQRRSVQGYSPGAIVGPLPEAAVEAGHLAHVAWLYGGIEYSTATGAPPAAAVGGLLPIWTRRRRG
jgi:hypothetical protein